LDDPLTQIVIQVRTGSIKMKAFTSSSVLAKIR